jgi:hypothetical protein
MLASNMVVHAVDAALHNARETLDSVGMDIRLALPPTVESAAMPDRIAPNSICFFFAMWYLASRNEFMPGGTVYSRLPKSLRFREVTIRDNSASEVK